MSDTSVYQSTSNSHGGSPEKVSPGRYHARIVRATDTVLKGKGYHRVQIDLEITGPDHAGELETKQYYLSSKKAAEFLKKEFAKLGVAVASASDLARACERLEGMEAAINIVCAPSGNKAIYIVGPVTPDPEISTDFDSIWG